MLADILGNPNIPLRELYLHWNKFSQKGGNQIFESITTTN